MTDAFKVKVIRTADDPILSFPIRLEFSYSTRNIDDDSYFLVRDWIETQGVSYSSSDTSFYIRLKREADLRMVIFQWTSETLEFVVD